MHHQRFMEITVVSARGLKKVKHLSKMDVCVVVSLSNSSHTEQKTPVDKDGGTTPNWNFPMNFTINEEEAKKDRSMFLIFKVKCKRRLHTDKDIGEVQVPIKEFFDNGGDCKFVKYVTYQLKKSSGNKSRGQINLSYKFTDCAQETASFKIYEPKPIMAYPAEPVVLTQSPSRPPLKPPLGLAQSHVVMEAHPYPPAGYQIGEGIQSDGCSTVPVANMGSAYSVYNDGANYAMHLPPGCVMNYGHAQVVKPHQQQKQSLYRTEFNKVEVDADHLGAGYEDDDDLC